MAYYEICEKVESDGWEVVRDPSGSMGPYAFKGDQWVSYDDVTSIKDKLSFINDLGLGGARVWAIDLDDFRGKCASSARTYPLLRTINEELGIHLSNRAGKSLYPSSLIASNPSTMDITNYGTLFYFHVVKSS